MSSVEIFELARRVLLMDRGDGNASKMGGVPTLIRRGKKERIFQSPHVLEADAYSVALVRLDQPNTVNPPIDPLSASIDASLIAHVNFGVGNAVQSGVKLDWINGVNLTILAGSFSVDCEYPEEPDFTVDLPQLVSVVAAAGVRAPAAGGVSQARFTEKFSLLNGATELRAVPPRAHAVRLLTSRPDLYGGFQLNFLDAINVARATSWALLPTDPSEFPLGRGNRAVSVVNNSGVAARLALQWSIAL